MEVKAGCVVGKDYPERICDHDVASKENMAKMKLAYADGEKGVFGEGSFWGPLADPFVKGIKNLPSKKAKLAMKEADE